MKKNNDNKKRLFSGKAMVRRFLTIGVLAMVIGLFSTVAPVQANVTETAANSSVVEVTQRSWVFGPYVTIDRANAVARYARRKGYKARIIYNGCFLCGTRTYSVRVWR